MPMPTKMTHVTASAAITPVPASPTPPFPASTETYAASYAALHAIAERLRQATGATTVDSLVADVQAARRAYALCRSRLDAVRREIEAEVTASEADTAA